MSSGPAAQVGKAVQVLKEKLSQGLTHQWAEYAGGDVAVELVAGKRRGRRW